MRICLVDKFASEDFKKNGKKCNIKESFKRMNSFSEKFKVHFQNKIDRKREEVFKFILILLKIAKVI